MEPPDLSKLGPNGQLPPQANQPLPTDAPRKCGQCQHWHPPLSGCGWVPAMPPQMLLIGLFDALCEIADLRSLFINIGMDVQVLDEMHDMVPKVEFKMETPPAGQAAPDSPLVRP